MRNILKFSLVLAITILYSNSYGQLVLNEIMASNQSTIADPDNGDYVDWIELYNPTGADIDLMGFILSDGSDDYAINTSVIISAGGYQTIWADNIGNGLHANFKISSSGEEISLKTANGTIIDQIDLGAQLADVSFGRVPDGGADWFQIIAPTPGAMNVNQTISGQATQPTFSIEGGFYSSSQTVSITSAIPGAEIRVTTDGSEPTATSNLYTSPLNVGAKTGETQKTVISPADYTGNRNLATIIKAKIFHSDYAPSKTVANTYFIGLTKSDLPVISLSTDSDNLWDENTGLYVSGNGEIENWYQDWEREASFEYFDENGKKQVSQNVGTKIMGAWSRNFHQKSFSIIARKEYGTEELNYKFFKNRDYDSFKSVVIRNSGNEGDWGTQGTMLRDAFMQYMVKDRMDIDYQEYAPVAVYLNGEYWGLYNMREKLNEHYVGNVHPEVDSDNLDFLKNHFEVVEGDSLHMDLLHKFLASNDLSVQSNFDFVADMVDINSYMDYMTAEIFVSNADWPGNNIRYWRPRTLDGKWRWILYDTDFGYGLWTGRSPSENMLEACLADDGGMVGDNGVWPQNPPWATLLFRSLMNNDGFKNEFIQRFTAHLNSTFAPDRQAEIMASMKSVIASEIPNHYDEWNHKSGYDVDDWNWDCDAMLDFGKDRIGYMFDHLENQFGLSTKYSLFTKIDGTGLISVNSVDFDQTTFNDYYAGTDVSLVAKSIPGYKFKEWQTVDINSSTVELITFEETWSYEATGTDLGTNWRNPSYNFSNWPTGQARLGYGDVCNTDIMNPSNIKYPTYYFRKDFTITGTPDEYSNMLLELVRDDGAIVYINGTEVARTNMADGDASFNDYANNGVNYDDETTPLEFNIPANVLVTGTNTIAIEMHQVNSTSTDVGFDLQLTGIRTVTTGSFYSSSPTLNFTMNSDLAYSAIFEETATIPDVSINEAMASNSATIADEAGDYDDWIEIYNPHNSPVNIAGLFLSDIETNLRLWQIPDTDATKTTIPAGGYLIIWLDNEPIEGLLHAPFKLSSTNDKVFLTQGLGFENTIMDEMELFDQKQDLSYGPLTPSSGSNTFLQPTPGTINKAIVDYTGLVINEFMAVNNGSLVDEFGEYDDWIELYNTTNQPIDIGGMFVSDTATDPGMCRIPTDNPALTTIGAGEYLILWADKDPEQGGLHLDFSLSGSGDDIILSQLTGSGFQTIESVTYTLQNQDFSLGRLPNGTGAWEEFGIATPGAQNKHITAPVISGIVINEICARNTKSGEDNRGNTDDWVELYNTGTDPVNVGGLFFSDDPLNKLNWKISTVYPDSTTIPAGGYMTFWFDNEPDEGLHHIGLKLAVDESVGLYQLNGGTVNEIDYKDYPAQNVDISYGRMPNGGTSWQQLRPTMNSANKTLDGHSVTLLLRTTIDTLEILLTKDQLTYDVELNKLTSTVPIAEVSSIYPTVNTTINEQPTSYLEGKTSITVESNGQELTYTVNISKKLFSDASLSDLTLNYGTLSPAFNTDTKEYTVFLSGDVPEIPTLLPTASSVYAKTNVYNAAKIPGKSSVVVLAEDGTKEVYTVQFYQPGYTIIAKGDDWKYYDTNVFPGSSWADVSFDDTGWSTGSARLGYGGDGEVTEITKSESWQNHVSYFFRKSFNISHPEFYTSLTMELLRDDGAIVHLNGTPVIWSNVADQTIASISTLATAKTNLEDEQTYFTYDLPVDLLVEGENVIAVSVHQDEAGSSDLAFDVSLYAEKTMVSPSATQTLSFKKGWNLFSINVYPANTSPSSVLATAISQIGYIKDNESFYQPNNALSSLSIEPGKGYLLYAKSDFTVNVEGSVIADQVIGLEEGWNIIGVPSNSETSIDQLFGSMKSRLHTVKSFEQRVVLSQPAYLNLNIEFTPNNAYFIKMKKAALVTFE